MLAQENYSAIQQFPKTTKPGILSQALLLTNLSGYSKVKFSKNFVLKSPLLKRSSFISCR